MATRKTTLTTKAAGATLFAAPPGPGFAAVRVRIALIHPGIAERAKCVHQVGKGAGDVRAAP